MQISTFLDAFATVFPLQSAGYAKDAVGLQIGYDRGQELTRALVAYEITDEVIDEARGIGANLIVAYHPLIFPSLTEISDSTRTGSLVRRLVREGIALYVLHTAFDSHSELGSSALMASALGLADTSVLEGFGSSLEKIVVFVPMDAAEVVQEAMWRAGAGQIGNYDECSFSAEGIGTFRGNEKSNPAVGTRGVREQAGEVRLEMIVERWNSAAVVAAMIEAHPYEEVAFDRYALSNQHPKFGMGTIGSLPQALGPEELMGRLSSIFQTPVLRHNEVTKPAVRRIAFLAGAGMEYYSAARRLGADAFVTGDVRYHDFARAAFDGVLLVDAGHAETERFVVRGMHNAASGVYKSVDLHRNVPDSPIVESRVVPNAVRYHF